MAERVERHLSASAHPMQAEETKAVLRQGLALLRDLGLETADDLKRIRVMDEAVIPRLDALHHAAMAFGALRDDLLADDPCPAGAPHDNQR